MLDVIVIGGGPAGLSAALVLGRARKRTLLLDSGAPRNAGSLAVHGFLGHDGTPPDELRRRARAELACYPEVRVRDARAISIERAHPRVRVGLEGGEVLEARRALLAPGLLDLPPKIPGLREVWGQSVFSCPYCHGYELRDRPWGVLAIQKAIVHTVPICRAWTSDVTLFLNGRADLGDDVLRPLEQRGVRIERRSIAALRREGGELIAVELEDGEQVPCRALLLHPGTRQSDLVLFSGLALDAEGYVRVNEDHETSIRGVHAAGDCAGRRPQAVAAAADGAEAGTQIAEILTLEDAGLR